MKDSKIKKALLELTDIHHDHKEDIEVPTINKRPPSIPEDLDKIYEQDTEFTKEQMKICAKIAGSILVNSSRSDTQVSGEDIYEAIKREKIGFIVWHFDPRAGKEIKEVVDTKPNENKI